MRLNRTRGGAWLAAGVLAGMLWPGQPAEAAQSDYPTIALADYVFGCMASNGQTREALERCSCSIDVISSILTYERYVEAETIMRMRQVGGEKTVIFRTGPRVKETVSELRRAQAEAEIRCF